jgi:hypothetical protein
MNPIPSTMGSQAYRQAAIYPLPGSVKPLVALKAGKESPTKKRFKKVAPPDEESCRQLNLLARSYPFCIKFRANPSDPL